MDLELLAYEPTRPCDAPPLLFVHGAWHGAWCWAEHFLPAFARAGFAAYALSLRGHGGSAGRERLRWHGIDDYVTDVARAASRLPAPPVLIGHSLGGRVVQKYLTRYQAPGGVLLASVPPGGVLAALPGLVRRHPGAFLQATLTLSLAPLVATPELVRAHFFSDDMPDALVRRYAAQLGDESYRAFLDLAGLSLPRPEAVRTPLLVLGAAEDRLISPAMVYATARAYRTRATIFQPMAHDMMLEPGWEQVAATIMAWLRR